MSNDKTYDRLVQKMQEISILPQQTMGRFTPVYRTMIPLVKVSPWRMYAVVSLAVVFALYLLLGGAIIRVVSVLQRGF